MVYLIEPIVWIEWDRVRWRLDVMGKCYSTHELNMSGARIYIELAEGARRGYMGQVTEHISTITNM